ncbi:MAG: HAD family hydrolase [Clostridiales bacterium]|nr:HAD family hydrolase [Clostridiales bacterium]
MNKAVLLDFDDTLVYTNSFFEEAKALFFRFMEEEGFSLENLAQTLNDFDVANTKKAGYMAKECFPLALRQTYAHCCRLRGLAAEAHKAEFCEGLGHKVFESPLILVPGAQELLRNLSGDYALYLITQGDEETQTRRVRESGLVPWFKEICIGRVKTQGFFQDILGRHGIAPAASWSVGNSLRFDVLPALLNGMNAIHFLTPSWDFEHTEVEGRYYTAETLARCAELIREHGV